MEEEVRLLPWLQQSAIYFLDGWLNQIATPRILEFGAGGSTRWFGDHGWETYSVENNEHWFECVKKVAGPSVRLMLKPRPYGSIAKQFQPNSFNLILVDGRDRVCCFEQALPTLRPGGVIMLDNSDRSFYQKAFKLVEGWEMCTAKGEWSTTWWFKPGV